MFSNIGKDSKVSFVGGIASVKTVCSKAIYSNLELADYTLPFGGTGVKVI